MNEHGSGKNPVECSLDGFSTVVRTYQTMEELEELSQDISDFYARKAEEEMNRLWETGQWSKEKCPKFYTKNFIFRFIIISLHLSKKKYHGFKYTLKIRH